MIHLQKKGTALITGGSSGIGAEYARQLAASGYDLVLIARRKELLEALAAELEALHDIAVETIVADLIQDNDVKRVLTYIKNHDPLEILVNNAGLSVLSIFSKAELSRLLDMMTLHMQTSIRLTHAALTGMIKNNHGAIIMVSSYGSFNPMPYTSVYGASKAFLNHFVEALSLELAGTNIIVQSLCPGLTRTDIVNTPDFISSGFNEKSMPKWLWMDAEPVVKSSLSRLNRRSVIVVPGWWNKWISFFGTIRNLPVLRSITRLIYRIMSDWMQDQARREAK